MIKITNKIDRNLLAIILIDIALFSGFLYLFFVIRNERQVVLVESMANLFELERKEANYFSLSKSIKDTTAEQAKLDLYVLNKKRIADFMELLEGTAKNLNVKLVKSVSTERVKSGSIENLLRLNVRVMGKFSDTLYFLNLMEELPYKARVKRMGFASGGVTNATAEYSPPKKGTAVNDTWTGEVNFEVLSYINE